MDKRDALPGARVVVVGHDPRRMAALRAARGCLVIDQVAAWPPSHARLDTCDAVVVAVPISRRGEVIRRALGAGKNVLAESPLGDDEEDARDLARWADARGLRLAVSFPRRFEPPVRDALGLIRSWSIGRVEGLRVEIGREDPRGLIDACDLIRRFQGEVNSALGQETLALFRNGQLSVAELRWVEGDAPPLFDILGSDGYLRVVTGPGRLSGRLADGRRVRRRYHLARLTDFWLCRRRCCPRSLIDECEAFVGISGRATSLATGWDGCRSLEMVSALERSAAVDGEVSLRPLPIRLPGERRGIRARRLD